MNRRSPIGQPERIRIALSDDASGSIPLSLPRRRVWPAGIFTGIFFLVMTSISWGAISSIHRSAVHDFSDLGIILFSSFWVLGWSAGALFFGALTVLLLFYRESALIQGDRLVVGPRLGPIRIRAEYELVKIRDVHVESAAAKNGVAMARVRFGYRGGTTGLGDAMPLPRAEHLVRMLEHARATVATIATTSATQEEDAAGLSKPFEPPSAAVDTDAPPFSWAAPSMISLVAANAIPLAGVLLFHWDLGQLLLLFWAESAVIGFYNLLKLIVVAKWGALFIGPFFAGHYGGFMAGHLLFIYVLFIKGAEGGVSGEPVTTTLRSLFAPLWVALLAMFISHGLSFFLNFIGRKEYRTANVGTLMAAPYGRIVMMHVTIIAGGWIIMMLGSPLPALALLVVLKTAADFRAHRKEHGSGPAMLAARRGASASAS